MLSITAKYQKEFFMKQALTIQGKQMLEGVGDYAAFFRSFIKNMFSEGFEWNELIRQCYLIGLKSLNIVLVTGFVLGFVLTLQSQPTLKAFGAEGYVPNMVAVSIIREIGPVIISLICAGKIASGIGAEIGSMKVTEQIAAMDVSGANSMQYLAVTRILACIFMVPLLVLFADAMSLVGGFVGTNVSGNMTSVLYFNKSFSSLLFSDFFPSLIKTFFFGFIIGFIACYKGFHANRGTESVGIAANSAVVSASFWIIIVDALAVQLTSIFVYNQ
jgi:phospholipid/cholesterol/gamma-HCH transport system permease protein